MVMDPRQEGAVELLGLGCSKKQTAEAVKVSTRTLRRWCQEPKFAAALKSESESNRIIAGGHVDALIASDVEEALKSQSLLAGIRDNENAPANLRFRCAVQLLNNGHKWAGFLDRIERANAAQAAKLNQAAQKIAERVEEVKEELEPEKENEKRPKADMPMPIEGQPAVRNEKPAAESEADSHNPEPRKPLLERMGDRVRQRNLQ